MAENKNNKLHNSDDEPVLERNNFEAPDSNVEDVDVDSFEPLEKPDEFIEDLTDVELAQVEAELEAEAQKEAKRKADKLKAREKARKAFEEARLKHERDMAAENRRIEELRSSESYPRTNLSYEDTTFPSNSYAYSEPYKMSTPSEGATVSYIDNNYETSPSSVAARDVDNFITNTEYQSIRDNYEASKAAFRSYGDNVPEDIVNKHREISELYFSTERRVQEGSLSVIDQTQAVSPQNQFTSQDAPSVREDTGHNTPFASDYERSESDRGGYSHRESSTPTYNSNSGLTQDYQIENSERQIRTHTEPNAFYEDMARRASVVQEQVRANASFLSSESDYKKEPTSHHSSMSDSPERNQHTERANNSTTDTPRASTGEATRGGSSSEQTSSPEVFSPKVISQARYDALRDKYFASVSEIASFGGKDIPEPILKRNEQISRLYEAINDKVSNGTVVVSNTASSSNRNFSERFYSSPKNQSNNQNLSKQPGALGSQVFTEINKDNFSPRRTRTGDGHVNSAKTPFEAKSISKYSELKIHHAHAYSQPFEFVGRNTAGALSRAILFTARTEQSGTANTMFEATERAREAVLVARTLKDTPRQIAAAYYSASNAVIAARNVGRFLEGKELLTPQAHKAFTIKQIDKQLANPFSGSEKLKMDKKFGAATGFSDFKIQSRITAKITQNKALKNEIKALQTKATPLTADERKTLKALMDKKKAADVELRKLHGLKKARAEAQKNNRTIDRTSKRDAEKTIKKLSKKGGKLTKTEKGALDRLKNRRDLLNKRGKLSKAKAARKGLLMSLGSVLGKAARESEESSVRSLISASRAFQNRYVRAVLKYTVKITMAPLKGVGKLAGKGVKALNKKIAKAVAEKGVKKVVSSRVYKELNGGLYRRVSEKISSHVPQKIKTKANAASNAVNKLKEKSKKVLEKFNAWKKRLANSKFGKAVSALGKGFGSFFNALGIIKKVLVKFALIGTCGLVVIALIGAAVTAGGGAASSFVFGDEDDDGRINLGSYLKVYNKAEEDFLDDINSTVQKLDKDYDNVFVNYQNGTMINNFKEIMSMAAVYFQNDFDSTYNNQKTIEDYIESLYFDSHYFDQVEGEKYSCSGCEERYFWCTDLPDLYASSKRKQLYDDYGERGGCKSERYSCSGCVTTTITKYCENRNCSTKYHNNGSPMASNSGCSNCVRLGSNGTETYYICQGHSYCPGHKETIVSCPGNHIRYYCDKHKEVICRGEHIDIDINVMVLDFDEIFYADSENYVVVDGFNTSDRQVTNGELIGTFLVTYYCTERYPHICNAGPPYKTASGTTVTPGRTIAVDKSVIPLGTCVMINGHEYVAEDTGGAIKGNRIDIAVATHAEALQLGKKTFRVYKSKDLSVSGGVEANKTRGHVLYIDLANEAAELQKEYGETSLGSSNILRAFGLAKGNSKTGMYFEPGTSLANIEAALARWDEDHKDTPFTNAELNVFEYVKMTREDLAALATKRTGKTYKKQTSYQLIRDVLIPYDRDHPDVYVVEPESQETSELYFDGWTEENIELAKNIRENINSENYSGLDYLDDAIKDNVTFEGVVFNQGETNVVYYNQYDIRWKSLPYSSSTISKSGCAPTSMAMVVSTLSGTTVDPVQMCNWASQNGYYIEGTGTSWSFISAAASKWGLSCKDMGSGNASQVVKALSEGKLVVMSTGPGQYYGGQGHFLVLRGVDENGKILVADPASKDKSERSWTLDQIMSGLKNWWIIGP